MRSKKLISLLCAATMSVSSFAGLATTASAAGTPVFTYDGSATDGWTNSGTTTRVVTDDDGKYLEITGGTGNNLQSATYALPAEAKLTNDYVIDFDTTIHAANGMGRLNWYSQVAFAKASPNQDTQKYGDPYASAVTAAYPVKVKNNGNIVDASFNGGADIGGGYVSDSVAVSVTSRFELFDKWIVNYKGDAAPSLDDGDVQTGKDEWVRVRAEVKNGKAKVTMKTTKATLLNGVEFDSMTDALSSVIVTAGRGDTNFWAADGSFEGTGVGVTCIDNINIYDGIANAPALTTEGLRGEAVVIEYGSPEKVSGNAPALIIPERDGITDNMTADFEADAVKSLSLANNEAADYDAETMGKMSISNGDVSLSIGARNGGDSGILSSAGVVSTNGGTKAVKLQGGKYSNGGRSPMLHLADDLTVSDGETAYLGFAVYLSKANVDGTPKLWLVDADHAAPLENGKSKDIDTSATASAYYKAVYGVLTAEENFDAENYKFSRTASKGIYLTPDEWHTVAVAVTAGGAFRVFVDGVYKTDGTLSPAVKDDVLNYGDSAYAAVNLPVLAVENAGSSVNSCVLIDNVVAYKASAIEAEYLPTVGEAPKAPVSVSAKYEGDTTGNGTLTVTPTEPTKAVVIKVSGDNAEAKIIAKYEENNLLADATPITVEGAKVGDKFFVWDSVEGMKPLLRTPVVVSATQGAAATYKVTVAATTNGSVTVTPATAVSDGVKAGTEVTLTVTPADGYEIDTLTVTDELGTKVDVNNNKFTMPAKKVTVKATFKAKTYTVSGTVDAGVKAVTLHPSVADDDHTGDIKGTITNGSVTFANVAKGDYTVTVKLNEGYTAPVVKVGDTVAAANKITVAGDVANLAVTTTAPALPDITGTVTITGTAKVGEKLTATANITVPAGAEAKYQWQVADTADGTYTDIAGETANEFTLTADQLGKFVKVVVTTEGAKGSIASDPTVAVVAKTYTVTVNAATNGKVVADKAAAAEGETVTLTVTPDEMYVLDTLTVKDENDAAVTVSDNKFTMPAKAVTITATFIADPSKQVATLSHTAHSQWKSSDPNETSADNASEYFAGDDGWNWPACAYMEFDLSDVDASTLDTAELTFTATSAKTYESKLFYLTADVDLTTGLTVSAADAFKESRVAINESIPSVKGGLTIKQDVTDAVKARLLEGKTNVILMITGNNGGATLSGKGSTAEPKLVITKGEEAGKPITVTVKDDTGAAVEGATVSAVTKPTAETAGLFAALNPVYVTSAKTNAEGKATLRLADGDYIITAVKGGQTIKAIDATVSAESPASVEIKETAYAVTVGGGADSVAIPNGDLYTAPAAFTAAVTADTVAVDDAAVAWSLTTDATGVSIDAKTGVITVGKTAAAGTVTVQATYTTPEGKKVSGTKDVALTAVAIDKVTVNGDNEAAIPDADSEVVATYTATAADKYGNAIALTDKTITWSVTADKGATISDGALTVASTAVDKDKVTVTAKIDEVDGTKEVTLIKAVTYEITVTTPENGTLTSNKAKSAADRTVTLTVAPATGYEVSEVKVVKTGEDATTVETTKASDTTYTFTMPAYAVTASVTYVKTNYTITDGTASDANGSITLSKTTANYGDEITVTAKPDSEDYVLGTLTYQIGDKEPVAITDGKFIMPAANVTVTATFTTPVKNYLNEDFESYTAENWWSNIKNETSTKALGNITVSKNYVSDKSDGTSAGIADIDSNKYLKLNAANFSTSGRGNRVELEGLALPNVTDIPNGFSLVTSFKAQPTGTAAATIVGCEPTIKAGLNGFVSGKWSDVTIVINNDKSAYMVVTTEGDTTVTNFTFAADALTKITLFESGITLGLDDMIIGVAKTPYTGNATITVKSGEEVLADATVSVAGSKLTSNASGVANIVLPVGTYNIVASKYGYVKNSGTLTVEKDGTNAAEIALTAITPTTFKVTLPEAAGESGVTVMLKVAGTPTDTTEAAVDTTVNVTVAAGETVGTASYPLLPGTYTYSMDMTEAYKAVVSSAVTVAGENNITLETNSQTLGSITVDDSALNTGILTTTQASKVVGKLSTVQKDAEGTEMVTPEAVTWAVKNEANTDPVDGITVAEDGTVSITNAVAAGTYKVTATGKDTTTVSSEPYSLVIAATGTETVKAASEDFEGETNIFGIETKDTTVKDDTMILNWDVSGKTDANLGNVLALGKGNKSVALSLKNSIAVETDQSINISFNPYNGWASSTKECYSVVTVKNSNNDELFSYTYRSGYAGNKDCAKVIDVKIGGVTASDFVNFDFQTGSSDGTRNANGFETSKQWYSAAEKTHVSLTIDSDGNVTAVFTNDNDQATTKTKTITGKIDGKQLNFGSLVLEQVDGAGLPARALAIDNLVTTISKEAE